MADTISVRVILCDIFLHLSHFIAIHPSYAPVHSHITICSSSPHSGHLCTIPGDFRSIHNQWVDYLFNVFLSVGVRRECSPQLVVGVHPVRCPIKKFPLIFLTPLLLQEAPPSALVNIRFSYFLPHPIRAFVYERLEYWVSVYCCHYLFDTKI